ncbi:MAG: AAA-like domain-containing protein [Lachnospiraceae bacterium]|nr:AAA-like domain-containing protein [Lachnospiraceae bacterium]
MAKVFNVNGACKPDRHYMVDLETRLKEIKAMVDAGEYFTIHRARQYGKTTTLCALTEYLKHEYEVVNIDFQVMSALSFQDEQTFVAAFSEELLDVVEHFPDGIEKRLIAFVEGMARINSLQSLFKVLKSWCSKADKKIVLIIDEVDTATNNQVFLDFLAQLRAYYLKRPDTITFQSVILAGVYDVRNIKRKIRADEEEKENSPWNIAADFLVNMSFSVDDIAGMLKEYEADYHTGMHIAQISNLMYDYTSGYPYLVSRLCKFMDERIAGKEGFPDKSSVWTRNGFLVAVKLLIEDNNPLFDSLTNKLKDFPELNVVISRLLFQGQSIAYNADDVAVRNARMFGFVKIEHSMVQIANRIFETRLYNKFLLDYKEQNSEIYGEGSRQKNQFIIDGHLNMKLVLEKFVETFDYLYGDRDDTFLEDEGRRYFMLFLKPILNGIGNCYVEPETRNRERMDLVIDYHGVQSICELKIWHGNAYHERGEEQLSNYLDYFKLTKGYMLSFNFNKKKTIGVKEIVLGDKVLIEAVV